MDGEPFGRLQRARERAVSAARRRADGHRRDAARSHPVFDAGAGRRHADADHADRIRGQRARQGELLARGAQHLRHRPARQAADGRRNVQPAGQLEQLSAAQARRPRRRAGARRGLLLPHLAAAGLRPADALHQRRRVAPPTPSRTATRCCCPTAITRCRRRRATSSITSGRWPAPSASSRSTRIPRTRGSTRRSPEQLALQFALARADSANC